MFWILSYEFLKLGYVSRWVCGLMFLEVSMCYGVCWMHNLHARRTCQGIRVREQRETQGMGLCETPGAHGHMRLAWACPAHATKAYYPPHACQRMSWHDFGPFWSILEILSTPLIFSWSRKVEWNILPYF